MGKLFVPFHIIVHVNDNTATNYLSGPTQQSNVGSWCDQLHCPIYLCVIKEKVLNTQSYDFIKRMSRSSYFPF